MGELCVPEPPNSTAICKQPYSHPVGKLPCCSQGPSCLPAPSWALGSRLSLPHTQLRPQHCPESPQPMSPLTPSQLHEQLPHLNSASSSSLSARDTTPPVKPASNTRSPTFNLCVLILHAHLYSRPVSATSFSLQSSPVLASFSLGNEKHL